MAAAMLRIRFVAAVALLAVSGALSAHSAVTKEFESKVDAAFEDILAKIQVVPFLGGKHSDFLLCPLDLAADKASDIGCRMRLPNESDEIRELLPYLLKDIEAMTMWKLHFKRHTSEKVAEASKFMFSLSHESMVALGEEEFWDSVPAVSEAAVILTKTKIAEKAFAMSAEDERRNAHLVPKWEPEVSAHFKAVSIKDAKKLMGTYLTKQANPGKRVLPESEPLPERQYENLFPVKQREFDARDHFKGCEGVIGHVRDQGSCGSCWAFASTESFNDRLCIASGGTETVILSPQHTTSCCDGLHCLSFGCEGGQPRMAWRWFSRLGVVSGGDYDELNSGKSCWPYEVPFCNHQSDGKYPDCSSLPMHKTPACRRECEETDYTKNFRPFSQDIHKAASSYSVVGVEKIKHELLTEGPLSAAFMVYADFLLYKSGVYEHVQGPPMGGHAVKVIGFGNEDNKDFWLATNSWNEDWGDKGNFKIKLGECGIDDEFCGGTVARKRIAAAVAPTEDYKVEAEKVSVIEIMGGLDL